MLGGWRGAGLAKTVAVVAMVMAAASCRESPDPKPAASDQDGGPVEDSANREKEPGSLAGDPLKRPLPPPTAARPDWDLKGREKETAEKILAMEPGEARDLALTEIIERWAEEDHEAAWAFREELPDDRDVRRAYYRGVMPKLAVELPDLVLDTVASGQWWPDQWKAEREAVLRVATYDLDKATTHFAATGERKQHKEVAYRFAYEITQAKGREAAMAWSRELEADHARGWATRSIARSWHDEDPTAAQTWLGTLDEPGLRDNASVGFAEATWDEPETSVSHARAIGDDELRQDTLKRLASSWRRMGREDEIQVLMLDPGALSPDDARAVDEALNATP